MKRSRTGSSTGKAPAVSSVASVQVPLPLLDVLADAQTASFGLCLTAGQQVFQTMMEQDRAQLCGPKNVPNPERQAYRGGSTGAFGKLSKTPFVAPIFLMPSFEPGLPSQGRYDLSRFDAGVFLAFHHPIIEPEIEVRRITYSQAPLSRNDYEATIAVFRLTRRFDF